MDVQRVRTMITCDPRATPLANSSAHNSQPVSATCSCAESESSDLQVRTADVGAFVISTHNGSCQMHKQDKHMLRELLVLPRLYTQMLYIQLCVIMLYT